MLKPVFASYIALKSIVSKNHFLLNDGMRQKDWIAQLLARTRNPVGFHFNGKWLNYAQFPKKLSCKLPQSVQIAAKYEMFHTHFVLMAKHAIIVRCQTHLKSG